MRWRSVTAALVACFFICLAAPGIEAQEQTKSRVDAGGTVAPTAALERGRTVFVLSSCHFCHGIDLTGASMGAADLMHSPLVGADRNGNLIGSIVLAGLPNLQTAMPKFADLTKDEISDLAAYIHYLRQQGRYKELMAGKLAAGDSWAGKTYFDGSGGCGKCHSAGHLKPILQKYNEDMLRSKLLRPGPAVPQENVTPSAGEQAHLRLLENYSPMDVANVMAYLQHLP